MMFRARLYERRGQPHRAIKGYTEVIQVDPKNWTAYNNRCCAYVRIGDIGRALRDCDKALGLRDDVATIYDSRGAAYSQRGDFTRALAGFDRSLQIDPTLGASYFNRASVYRKRGQLQQAADDYRTLLGLSGERWKEERRRAVQALAEIDEQRTGRRALITRRRRPLNGCLPNQATGDSSLIRTLRRWTGLVGNTFAIRLSRLSRRRSE